MDWPKYYAERLAALGHSEVVQILELAARDDVVSLAGGLPAPESFLIDETRAETAELLTDLGPSALGYGPTEGLPVLRDTLAERMSEKGRPTGRDEILVTTGGIAALDLVCKALIDPGDVVLVEEPSYLAALHVFRSYGAEFLGAPTDDQGVQLDGLADRLAAAEKSGRLPKLFYLVPSFQNPSGRCLSDERRGPLLDLCARYGVIVLEDGAYEDLRFEGSFQPNLASLDSRVIHLNTFSKILHPGVRLGWAVGDPELIETLALCKQGQDQCSATASQYLAERFLRKGLVDRQLEGARRIYRERRDLTLDAVAKDFPDGTLCSRPEGGFYCWIDLPGGLNATDLLPEVVAAERVAYVAGSAFYHDRRMGGHQLRLAFSYVTSDVLGDAAGRLGRFFKDRLTG